MARRKFSGQTLQFTVEHGHKSSPYISAIKFCSKETSELYAEGLLTAKINYVGDTVLGVDVYLTVGEKQIRICKSPITGGDIVTIVAAKNSTANTKIVNKATGTANKKPTVFDENEDPVEFVFDEAEDETDQDE